MPMLYARRRAGRRGAALLAAGASFLLLAISVPARAGDVLPSETPATFTPRVDTYD
jgi:hypothetical protein